MKSKKAMVFHVSLVLVTVIALTYAYIVLDNIHDEAPTYTVGERQFGLFESYQAYHEQLQVLGQQTEPRVAEAIIALADHGGFFKQEATEGNTYPCGSVGGYALWNTLQQDIEDCYPGEYENNFERHLNEISPESLSVKAITTEGQRTKLILKSARSLQSQGKFREEPDYSYSSTTPEGSECDEEGVCTPPIVGYTEAEALQGPSCPSHPENAKTSRCFYLPENEFSELYSISDPLEQHLSIAYPDGNALQYDLARHLINISEQWYEQECERSDRDSCQARIGISSLSTGDSHASTSHHHIGNAADIYACYDAEGERHTAEEYSMDGDQVFGRCHDLIKSYFAENMQQGATFISGEECLGRSCKNLKREEQAALMSSHNDHIHINPPDTVLT